jgi:hypothetical protein
MRSSTYSYVRALQAICPRKTLPSIEKRPQPCFSNLQDTKSAYQGHRLSNYRMGWLNERKTELMEIRTARSRTPRPGRGRRAGRGMPRSRTCG